MCVCWEGGGVYLLHLCCSLLAKTVGDCFALAITWIENSKLNLLREVPTLGVVDCHIWYDGLLLSLGFAGEFANFGSSFFFFLGGGGGCCIPAPPPPTPSKEWERQIHASHHAHQGNLWCGFKLAKIKGEVVWFEFLLVTQTRHASPTLKTFHTILATKV